MLAKSQATKPHPRQHRRPQNRDDHERAEAVAHHLLFIRKTGHGSKSIAAQFSVGFRSKIGVNPTDPSSPISTSIFCPRFTFRCTSPTWTSTALPLCTLNSSCVDERPLASL